MRISDLFPPILLVRLAYQCKFIYHQLFYDYVDSFYNLFFYLINCKHPLEGIGIRAYLALPHIHSNYRGQICYKIFVAQFQI